MYLRCAHGLGLCSILTCWFALPCFPAWSEHIEHHTHMKHSGDPLDGLERALWCVVHGVDLNCVWMHISCHFFRSICTEVQFQNCYGLQLYNLPMESKLLISIFKRNKASTDYFLIEWQWTVNKVKEIVLSPFHFLRNMVENRSWGLTQEDLRNGTSE